jgi:hypothetical protein
MSNRANLIGGRKGQINLARQAVRRYAGKPGKLARAARARFLKVLRNTTTTSG